MDARAHIRVSPVRPGASLSNLCQWEGTGCLERFRIGTGDKGSFRSILGHRTIAEPMAFQLMVIRRTTLIDAPQADIQTKRLLQKGLLLGHWLEACRASVREESGVAGT